MLAIIRHLYMTLLIMMFTRRAQSDPNIRQSLIALSTNGFEFAPTDEQALLLLESTAISVTACAQKCHETTLCRTFNFDLQISRCRLYEGDATTTGSIIISSSPRAMYGSRRLDVDDFADFGRPCSACVDSRSLRCANGTCGCQVHSYFDGSVCRSEKLRGATCSSDNECRRDLNLTCMWNTICEYNGTVSYPSTSGSASPTITIPSTTSTSASSTSTTSTSTSTSTSSTSTTSTSTTATSTSTTTTTTTTTRIPCNSSCTNQTWTSSANLQARWLFDGNYLDTANNYNATPTTAMSFISYGYLQGALGFPASATPMLTTRHIPLSSTSFTIDAWLYPTGFWNANDHGLFGFCSAIVFSQCLHITIRQNAPNYYLYLGFFNSDCQGVTPIILNKWIHATFVADVASLQQKIYLNGVLENTCSISSGLNVAAVNFTIGYVPLISDAGGSITYFQGYMDQVTVSTRAKSSCEILELATLVAYFTFDDPTLVVDSGPNSFTATTQSVSMVSSGRFSQAIFFNGSNSSYFQASGFNALGVSNTPFSFSLWIRPIVLQGVIVHVSNQQDGGGWCMPFLAFTPNNSLVAQIYNSSFVVPVVDSTRSVNTSVWSHVVQTWSAGNGLRLYVNNVLVASELPSAAYYEASGNTNYVTVGNAFKRIPVCAFGVADDVPYKGDIDDFRVYSRELSASDVCALFIA